MQGKEVNLQCRENKNNLNFLEAEQRIASWCEQKIDTLKNVLSSKREMTRKSIKKKVDRLESERQQIQLQLSPS